MLYTKDCFLLYDIAQWYQYCIERIVVHFFIVSTALQVRRHLWDATYMLWVYIVIASYSIEWTQVYSKYLTLTYMASS